jgi:hypothetical protein
MRSHVSIFLAMLVMLAAPCALALGGQDVLIDDADTGWSDLRDVVATEDGVLFAIGPGDTGDTLMNIYRSDDGGSRWDYWSELAPVTAGAEFNEGHIEATNDVPAALVVVWVERRLDSPNVGAWLQTARAEIVESGPIWTIQELHFSTDWTMGPAALSRREGTTAQDRLAVAWEVDNGFHYATSGSGGITWQPTLTLPVNRGNAADLDVVADESGVVHLLWGTSDFTADVSAIRYCRATGNGADVSDWGAEQTLIEFSPAGAQYVSITADPGGDGVIAAASRGDLLRVLGSGDAGLNWNAAQEYVGLSRPDGAWGAAGPFLGVDCDTTSGFAEGRAILSPDGSPAGPWSADPMMAETTNSRFGTRLAVDPSHGGAPMLVTMRAVVGDVDEYFRVWFDAAWRDAPGYGVPEPMLPILTGGLDITRPVLPGDVDGDATLELVYIEATSATTHTLHVWDPDLEAVVVSSSSVHPTADFALLDVDGDSELEMVYFSANGEVLYARNADGQYVAGYPVLPGTTLGAGWISGAPVKGDASDDVVVAGEDKVWVLGPHGGNRAGFPWNAPALAGTANGRVAIGDVDNDGRLDLVAPFTGGLALIDRDGLLMATIGQGEPSPGSPSLHDFDGDGDLEIAYPRADGSVHLVHHDGTPVTTAWPYASGAAGMPSQIALANMDATGNHDLVFTTPDDQLHVVTASGTALTDWPRPMALAGAVVDPIVAQLGAGGLTAAVGKPDGRLRLIEATAGQEGWPRNQTAPIHAPVSAADIDADGMIEMIVPTSEAIWVLDMGVAQTGGLWPISGADVARTGCLTVDAATPVSDRAPAALTLGGNYPNPFNPRTTIHFRVEADAARASLRIYDVAGRLVRTLLDGAVGAGDHRIVWQGRDDRGGEVASGVYFYRLEVDGASWSRSMVLVR